MINKIYLINLFKTISIIVIPVKDKFHLYLMSLSIQELVFHKALYRPQYQGQDHLINCLDKNTLQIFKIKHSDHTQNKHLPLKWIISS